MKSHLFLASLLLPATLFAQSGVPTLVPDAPPQPPRRVRVVNPQFQMPSDVLADNYQITLTVTDKDTQPVELSVVVASGHFSARSGDQNLSFLGTVAIEENGSAVVTYSLGWETHTPPVSPNSQLISSSTEASVRLVPGKEMLILKVGTRNVRLLITKL